MLKNSLYKLGLLLSCFALFLVTACDIDEVTDPNNPSLGSVLNNASKAELQVLIIGLEARNRVAFQNATEMFGVFGREVYAFFGSDPRFVNDWLGLEITETYPDFFASAGTYVNPYLTVKQANVLIQATDGSDQITTEEANGYKGFANTIKAYQLLWPLMQQYQNGIRVDVADPLNPGPTLPYDQALQQIRAILDEGYQQLNQSGADFSFSLTSGFSDFNTPAGMAEVNRAIAARAALYAGDWQGALTALENSFMNLNPTSIDDLYVGPDLVYGEAPDINNPLFYPFDRSTRTILIVHPDLIEDALPGDQRIERKFAERVANPLTDANVVDPNGDLIVGRYQDARWETNTDPIPFIRNEELILIYAEAQARLGNVPEAVSAINTIRNLWGLPDYMGATDTEALIDEILFQRRYSLWAEGGHRWIDLRRTGRLNANYVDLREGGNIFTQVARRVSEIAWDER